MTNIGHDPAHAMAQGIKLDPNERAAFLRILSHCGDVRLSCEKAGVGKTAIYELRQEEDGFEVQFQAALTDFRRLATPDVLSRAMQLAVEGTEEYVTCKDGLVLGPDGQPVMQRRFYPNHVTRMLESLMPDTFGRREVQTRINVVPAELQPDPEPTPDEQGPVHPI